MTTCDIVFTEEELFIGTLDPDIVGTGILVSFVATAYLTLLLVCVCYICHYVPTEIMQRVDCSLVDVTWHEARLLFRTNLKPAIYTAILMLSDQQLITGIAIIVSAYAHLANDISCYHWQVVVYLAWYSSLTHLATLTILRQYFRDNAAARVWRLFLMTLLLIMLTFALLPTGDSPWSDIGMGTNVGALPALCGFKRLFTPTPEQHYEFSLFPSPNMFVSLAILIVSYTSRTLALSQTGSKFTKTWFRVKPGNLLKRAIIASIERAQHSKFKSFHTMVYLLLKISHVELSILFDVYGSMLWELLWLAFGLGWGTRRLFSIRSLGIRSANQAGIKERFGFGQVMPLMLLALPILSFAQTCYEKVQIQQQRTKEEKQHELSALGVRVINSTHGGSYLRIGVWPTSTNAASGVGNVMQDRQNNFTRTGTELQHEENYAGMSSDPTGANIHIASNGESQAVASEQVETLASGSPHQQPASSSDLLFDYYQFEWYRILVGLVFLLSVETYVGALICGGDGLEFATAIVVTAGPGLAATLSYVTVFVIIAEYHDRMGTFVERYTYLSRHFQHKLLRVMGYLFPCAVVGVRTMVYFF